MNPQFEALLQRCQGREVTSAGDLTGEGFCIKEAATGREFTFPSAEQRSQFLGCSESEGMAAIAGAPEFAPQVAAPAEGKLPGRFREGLDNPDAVSALGGDLAGVDLNQLALQLDDQFAGKDGIIQFRILVTPNRRCLHTLCNAEAFPSRQTQDEVRRAAGGVDVLFLGDVELKMINNGEAPWRAGKANA